MGRMKEAMDDFNRTIELNNKYPNAFFNRAELRYGQGDFAGALSDYSRGRGAQARRSVDAQQPRACAVSDAAIRRGAARLFGGADGSIPSLRRRW